jgi:hypothetical protein
MNYANRVYRYTVVIENIKDKHIDQHKLMEYVEQILIDKKFKKFEVLGYDLVGYSDLEQAVHIGVESGEEAKDISKFLNTQIFDELHTNFKIKTTVAPWYLEPISVGPNKRIFMTNVPSDISYEDIIDITHDYGPVYDVHIHKKAKFSHSDGPNVFFNLCGARVARDFVRDMQQSKFKLRNYKVRVEMADKQSLRTQSKINSAKYYKDHYGAQPPSNKNTNRQVSASNTREFTPSGNSDVLVVNAIEEDWDTEISAISTSNIQIVANPVVTAKEDPTKRKAASVSQETAKVSKLNTQLVSDDSDDDVISTAEPVRRAMYMPPPVLQLQTVQRVLPQGVNIINLQGGGSEGSIKCYLVVKTRVAERVTISVNMEMHGSEDVEQRNNHALVQMGKGCDKAKKEEEKN